MKKVTALAMAAVVAASALTGLWIQFHSGDNSSSHRGKNRSCGSSFH